MDEKRAAAEGIHPTDTSSATLPDYPEKFEKKEYDVEIKGVDSTHSSSFDEIVIPSEHDEFIDPRLKD